MLPGTDLCTKCHHKTTFFHRQYSGERLCKQCFTSSIEEKVRSTILRYRMLNHKDIIALAVSGGKDSLSLLHILGKMEGKYPKASLVSITIDEGIRGYRNEALNIVRRNCETLGINNHIVSFSDLFGVTMDDVAKQTRQDTLNELTPCAYCGVLRRRALNSHRPHLGRRGSNNFDERFPRGYTPIIR
jgi:cytoplasmic tRNA 2-thiolation protein 1